MSHVNPEKAVAKQIMEKMDMGSMMEGMSPMKMEGMMPMMLNEGMASMMEKGMGPMMMNEGMASMMEKGMGPMMKMPGAATGVAVYTSYRAKESVLGKVFTHPLVAFSLGVIVGCYVYKYRKAIISTCAKPKEG